MAARSALAVHSSAAPSDASSIERTRVSIRKWLPLLAAAIIVACNSAAFAALKFVEVQKNGVGGVTNLDGANQAAVSSDGKHVYVAAENANAVVVFSRNAATGQLTFVESQQEGVGGVDGLGDAYSLTVSADGKHVYVASDGDNAVAVFSRDATTGQLTFVEVQKNGVAGVDGLLGASWLTLSPDDKHLYVCGFYDNALAVFSRDTTTGQLTFIEVQRDGVGGVDGLAAARSVAVSPDGKHVYVAGALDNAVAVFNGNATTGQLTFVEVQKQGVGGVDGIGQAFGVAVSPDGHQVYAAGLTSEAVAAFDRNPTTGQLTFVEAHKEGIGGVDGLFGASSVTVSPDGSRVYATGDLDDAVVEFLRDPVTGGLTFVEAIKDNVGGVDGLDGANAVTVSPDGVYVYVAGDVDSAVAVFKNSCGDGIVDARRAVRRRQYGEWRLLFRFLSDRGRHLPRHSRQAGASEGPTTGHRREQASDQILRAGEGQRRSDRRQPGCRRRGTRDLAGGRDAKSPDVHAPRRPGVDCACRRQWVRVRGFALRQQPCEERAHSEDGVRDIHAQRGDLREDIAGERCAAESWHTGGHETHHHQRQCILRQARRRRGRCDLEQRKHQQVVQDYGYDQQSCSQGGLSIASVVCAAQHVAHAPGAAVTVLE